MAKRERQVRKPPTPRAVPRPLAALRPVAWSAVVGAAFAVVVTAPAYGDPANVPDAGTKPVPSGELRLPGAPPTTAPTVAPVPGPLAAQIMAAETEVASLAERLKALDEELVAARATKDEAERAWREAADRLAELRADLDAAVEKAYKDAAELAPLGPLGRDLGKLLPPTAPPDGPETTPWDLARAESEERRASLVYSDAELVEQGLASQRDTVKAALDQRTAALLKLRQDNAAQLAQIEAAREAYEQSLAGQYGKAGKNVDGQQAHPDALKAVQHALKQLGKPYEWGAEGPNRYDCSGLVWDSYRQVGKSLPRVAKDQYRATTPVPVDKLLPGDLVFFATDRTNPSTIHHVGIYLGDNKMVHAPTTGDVVKISGIWWSRFYGATRVLPAVPAPKPSPTPPPSKPTPGPTTPAPDPTTPDPTTPAPDPTTPDPDPTTPAPDPTEPAEPDPTESPEPTAEPGSSPTPGEEPSPSATSATATGPAGTPDEGSSTTGDPGASSMSPA
ncbi:MAG: NlpC/P60 family protein [Micromonosporaceae bacterium]